MAKTYKTVEVAAPGSFRVVEKPIPEPGAGHVLIRVEACGVCHTDLFTVEDQSPGLRLTGTAIDIEDTLAFSVLQNVRPDDRNGSLEHAAEAYARMMRGEARFRIVLTTGQ